MTHKRETFLLNAWYQGRWWLYLLWPVSVLFRCLSQARRFYLCRQHAQQNSAQEKSQQSSSLSVPLIVVGNITLGGTGKTPLLIALVKHLQQRGFKPGVISRGYGGCAPTYPWSVTADSKASESGDEPLLIAMETSCPVMVGADRLATTAKILAENDCDILLSDDGLQHYRLPRDIEIAVVDGARGLGNGMCLPAGPLRESPARLQQVDFVVLNGSAKKPEQLKVDYHEMSLRPDQFVNIASAESVKADQFSSFNIAHAVAGIGNPSRFYQSLSELGIEPVAHDFPDHYSYNLSDFSFTQSYPLPVVMTAKDAVKCRDFAQPEWYYLSVESQLSSEFWVSFDELIDTKLSIRKEKSVK